MMNFIDELINNIKKQGLIHINYGINGIILKKLYN